MHSTCFSLCGVGHLAHSATVALPKATRTSVQMGGALAKTQTRYLFRIVTGSSNTFVSNL